MSVELQNLKNAYLDIARHEDRVGAYAEFDHAVSALEASDVDPAELASISSQNEQVLGHIATTRGLHTFTRGFSMGDYFRGTGAVLVATDEEILAYDYRGEGGDPVAEQYGRYQWAAMRKAGRGLLLAADGQREYPFPEAYRRLEDQLIEAGVKEPGTPHHLGYAWRSPARKGGVLVAGATGMLASDNLASLREVTEQRIIAADEVRGWVEWSGDRFAGYDDTVAARSVLRQTDLELDPYAALESFNALQAAGVNLH